jgi:hypothetical protein
MFIYIYILSYSFLNLEVLFATIVNLGALISVRCEVEQNI